MPGRIVLVATPIGNLGDLSPRATETLADADVICCEDTRRTRQLLASAGISGVPLLAVHEHNEAADGRSSSSAGPAGGDTVAVVTDAGMPGISDPGERLVPAAAEAGFDGGASCPARRPPWPPWSCAGCPPTASVRGVPAPQGRSRRAAAGRSWPARPAPSCSTRRRTAWPPPSATWPGCAAATGGSSLVRELTKLHEEVWRGTLAAASELCATREPRGEYVLVLGGAAPPRSATKRSARRSGAAGATAASVAADLGVAKNRVYDLAIRARRPRS